MARNSGNDVGARSIARLPGDEFEAVDDGRKRAMLVANRRERREHLRVRQIAFDGRHQHRNRRLLQDFLRLRAQHQPLDAAAAVRGDEDQVATARLGDMQNGFVRPVARHDGGFVRYAGHPRDHFGLGEDRPRFTRHVVVERIRRHDALECADARRAVVRLRVEKRHLRAERLGELDGVLNGLDRELRIVERNQQMPIHHMPPVISTACRR